MKKIDKTTQWLQNHLTLLECPVCHDKFQRVIDQQLVCVNGHSININKHGYVYFLRHGVRSEYDRPMLLARRAILEAGFFRGILTKINQYLSKQAMTILDVGTGEGTPIVQLEKARSDVSDTYVGFDISRAGVQLATQLDTHAFFCLADLRQLPFADHSFDAIMELFSPSDYQEFRRILKKQGKVFKVIPTANYLHEMRELLYANNDQHQQYDNSAVRELFAQNFPQHEIVNINYQFAVPQNLRSSMIEMSPLHWGKNVRKLTDAEIQQLTSVTVDVDLLIGTVN
ncbi:methyltransferase domain-containing protein [Limosilactobacillus caecicola]|uniref:methyltransferase domain-containing protein n=1 Tax=Limosilactobacillus caecicola TaxID=2941332 RepID=UPI002040BE67|nr:methyltransferase domain-containing protein [Limosilactobacillus caecicola]